LFKTLLAAGALRLVGLPLGLAVGSALTLAQIGEFSFVLGQQAQATGYLPPEQYKFVLGVAVLSMALTPLLVGKSAAVVKLFGREEGGVGTVLPGREDAARAIVVGYGPVGRTLTRILADFGIHPVVIDMNIETVKTLKTAGITAIYGDAGRRQILQAAKVEHASYLLVTLPDLAGRIPVVATARMLNSDLKILTRARYVAERAMMEDAGASAVSYEEAEVAVSLAEMLLKEIGAEGSKVEAEIRRIRDEIALRPER
jgi:monovalent cation:H+ antiporter-2, CPA2 family